MNNRMRVGSGYDVHQLVPRRRLILGGAEVESEMGLLGHSDADALSHAVGDALLGALALGDLGKHFPDTDERYAGVSSLLLLKEIGRMVAEKGYEICNIDSTIVLERPKLAAYILEMRQNLADSLSIEVDRVSVKATTSEKMGFPGREEGVAVYATALLAPNLSNG